MLKLSVAAALLLGANAVSSDIKNQAKTVVADVNDRNIGYIETITSIPLPNAADAQRTRDYWVGNQHCIDLFDQIITLRK